MSGAAPVLELDGAVSVPQPGIAASRAISLRLAPGEFALIDSRDIRATAAFADLCIGVAPLQAGAVRFLGFDWVGLPHRHAAALRGRIGRTFAGGGWIASMGVVDNIVLAQLHHTTRNEVELRSAALALTLAFGLPGLPLGRPADLAPVDLARAACARALLCDPLLILLESPVQAEFADIVAPLLNAITALRDKGAAVLWLTRSDLIWRDRTIPATQRLRLTDGVLAPARRAA